MPTTENQRLIAKRVASKINLLAAESEDLLSNGRLAALILDAIKESDASANLVWSSEKPTKEGWYWHRITSNSRPFCILVERMPVTKRLICYGQLHGEVKSFDGAWSGPITPPEEA